MHCNVPNRLPQSMHVIAYIWCFITFLKYNRFLAFDVSSLFSNIYNILYMFYRMVFLMKNPFLQDFITPYYYYDYY